MARRKAELSPRIVKKLCRRININPSAVLKDILKSLDTIGISVSKRTIQFYFNRNGLNENWPWRTPHHKPCHIVGRFNLAKTFWDKDKCFWEQVLWSDETKTELFRHNNVQKILRKKGETFLLKNIALTLKHGVSSMIFSGCFSKKETGKLIIIKGIMKTEDSIKCFDENLQLSAQNLHLGRWLTFQQDTDPKYWMKSMTMWLQKKNITVLPWPSRNPDWNSIENLRQE